MLPAYHVPLSVDRLKLIGEICAIQGQIEWIMLNTVWFALDIEKALALRIMGSTAIGTNADIWLRCVRKKQRNKYILAMAQRAHDEIKDLAEGRNDFVHAAYFARYKDEPDRHFTYVAEETRGAISDDIEAVAVRIRNEKIVPAERLEAVRDKAAIISIWMAHVHWRTIIERKLRGQPSPWLDRLSSLPPLNFPKPEPRRAKARKSPPPPSES